MTIKTKQLPSNLEVQLQKKRFLAKYHQFFGYWTVHIEPLSGWESTYVCLDLKIEKQRLYIK